MPRSSDSAETIRHLAKLEIYRQEMAQIAGPVRIDERSGHASVAPFGDLPVDAKLRLKWLLKRHALMVDGRDIEVRWTRSKSSPNRVFVHPVKNGTPFVEGTSPEPPRTTYRHRGPTPQQEVNRQADLAETIALRLMRPLSEVQRALASLPDNTEPLDHVRSFLAAG